jgi:hypothetical protein
VRYYAYGGGIYIDGHSGPSFTIQDNAIVSANSAKSNIKKAFGGGICMLNMDTAQYNDGAKFVKKGGMIYGNDSTDKANDNIADVGDALYMDNGPQWRNSSAGQDINSDSYGFWLDEEISLAISSKATEISANAYENTNSTTIIIPKNIKKIDEKAFYDGSLNDVTIGTGVKSIGKEAFANNQLTSIVIPPNVKTIGEDAFSGNNLTKIEIGSNVNMPDDAFTNEHWEFGEYNSGGKRGGVYTRAADSNDWVYQGPN